MDLNGTLTGQNITILSNVYIGSLTPSIIGSISVLVVSIVRWRHLHEQGHLLVQLSLADLLAALILMSTSIMNKTSAQYNATICQYSLPLSLTFYFVSFLLVVVCAWKSKNGPQGWRERPDNDELEQRQCSRKRVSIPVYAFVWLIPMVLYFLYIFSQVNKTSMFISPSFVKVIPSDENTYCNCCILFLHVWRDSCSDDEKNHNIFIRVFLVVVVISVIIICSMIYYKVSKWYETREQMGIFPMMGDGLSRRRYREVFSTTRNRVMVILICWVPALILILMSTLVTSTGIRQQSFFWLYIIQAVTVSLQGFLNSMVYAWRRPNFREAVLGEKTPLVTHGHHAFFEESLRGSGGNMQDKN